MTVVTAEARTAGGEPADTSNRLGHVGALDGLRGLALAAVLVYHGGFAFLPGGFLSISTFFTLSGFLITTLMIREIASTGRVHLRAFWTRRARRLLPASLFTLIGILVVHRAFDTVSPTNLRGDVLAALAYVQNWWLIHTDQPYGALFVQGSPVQHFWSLAIEEQYYLVFPVMMLAIRRGVRTNLARAATFAALGVASAAYAVHLSANLNRAYYSTFARASEILVGIVTAFLVAHVGSERIRSAQAVLDLAAVAGLIGLAWLWSSVGLHDAFVFHGATMLNSVLTAFVIVAGLGPGLTSRLLSLAPLRTLGLISYGAYLVHWPLFLILNPVRLGLGTNATFVVRVVATLATATAIYLLFEHPIRRRTMLRRSSSFWAVIAAGTATVIVLALVLPGSDRSVTDLSSVSPVRDQLSTLKHQPTNADARRVLVVGDSMSWSVSIGLEAWGRNHGVTVGLYSAVGCGAGGAGTLKYLGLVTTTGAECSDWDHGLTEAVREFDPDIVLVVVGLADLSPRRFPDGSYRSIGDPEFDRFLSRRVRSMARTLMTGGAQLAWARSAHVNVAPKPGTGPPPYVENDPRRTDALNRLVARALSTVPQASMIDLAGYMQSRPGGELDPAFRPDGAHLSAAGTDEVARWLGPQLTR